jgi:predicted nucleic acid-binding protein
VKPQAERQAFGKLNIRKDRNGSKANFAGRKYPASLLHRIPSCNGGKGFPALRKSGRREIVLIILPVVLAETFYTLKSYYRMPRKDIARKLAELIQARGLEAIEPARLANTLQRCAEKNADFADAYLAAAAVELKIPVSSFDLDFDKFKDVERIAP